MPAPKIAEAAENLRPTAPPDLDWADYDASGRDAEIEEPEEPHDRSMCQIQDCPKCKAIYEREQKRYRRTER